jgi:hypothetical protein
MQVASSRTMTRKDNFGNHLIMKAYLDDNNNDTHASFHLKLKSEDIFVKLKKIDFESVNLSMLLI